jgi:hypothetical protein
MSRLIIAVGIFVLTVLIASVLKRRRPAPPTQAEWQPPAQLDRADFGDANKRWLVAVFSSEVCDSCPKAVTAAQFLESDDVAFQNVSLQTFPALHDRYNIIQVPLILVADHEGVVLATYVGPPSSTDLWAEFALIREHSDH